MVQVACAGDKGDWHTGSNHEAWQAAKHAKHVPWSDRQQGPRGAVGSQPTWAWVLLEMAPCPPSPWGGSLSPECVPKSAVLASEQPPRWLEPYQRLAMAPMGLDSRGSHPGAMASQGGGRRGRGGVRSLEHSQAALDWA